MSKVTVEMLKKNPIAALEERRREILEEIKPLLEAFNAVERQLAIERGELKPSESTVIQ
jgi:hypothetical protein